MADGTKTRRVRPRLGGIVVALVAFASLAGAGLFHTFLRVRSMELGYRLSTVTHAHQKLEREHERLELEVATLEAPSRIERLARTKLGMVQPSASQVVVLREPMPPPSPAARPDETKDKPGVLASIAEVLHGG